MTTCFTCTIKDIEIRDFRREIREQECENDYIEREYERDMKMEKEKNKTLVDKVRTLGNKVRTHENEVEKMKKENKSEMEKQMRNHKNDVKNLSAELAELELMRLVCFGRDYYWTTYGERYEKVHPRMVEYKTYYNTCAKERVEYIFPYDWIHFINYVESTCGYSATYWKILKVRYNIGYTGISRVIDNTVIYTIAKRIRCIEKTRPCVNELFVKLFKKTITEVVDDYGEIDRDSYSEENESLISDY